MNCHETDATKRYPATLLTTQLAKSVRPHRRRLWILMIREHLILKIIITLDGTYLDQRPPITKFLDGWRRFA